MKKQIVLLLLPLFATAQHTFEQAEKYYGQKQYSKAEALFVPYLKEHPAHLKTIEYLGDIAGAKEDWGKAIHYYGALVQRDNKSANYHFKYGGAMGMKALNISRIRAVTYIGDIKKHFETAARLDLNHIEVRWALVEFYMQLPGILGGSEKKAQKYASQLLKISPVNGYLANGYIAEQGKRPKDAEVHYKKAIKTAPAGFKAHKNNRLNYQLGKIAAEYNIKAALGINSLRQYIKNYSNRDGVPKDWAYYRLAQIYKNLGEKQTALQWIGKALKARPNFEQAKAEQREIQGLKVQNSKRINKP